MLLLYGGENGGSRSANEVFGGLRCPATPPSVIDGA